MEKKETNSIWFDPSYSNFGIQRIGSIPMIFFCWFNESIVINHFIDLWNLSVRLFYWISLIRPSYLVWDFDEFGLDIFEYSKVVGAGSEHRGHIFLRGSVDIERKWFRVSGVKFIGPIALEIHGVDENHRRRGIEIICKKSSKINCQVLTFTGHTHFWLWVDLTQNQKRARNISQKHRFPWKISTFRKRHIALIQFNIDFILLWETLTDAERKKKIRRGQNDPECQPRSKNWIS